MALGTNMPNKFNIVIFDFLISICGTQYRTKWLKHILVFRDRYLNYSQNMIYLMPRLRKIQIFEFGLCTSNPQPKYEISYYNTYVVFLCNADLVQSILRCA